ncbi:uncharacterized protein LOC131674842, partial [Phymastichus coffea]|uniref:uncharacterized protein LOC131674842 n=1 Tax=Phymastichus coffea TaxID=108790 RepID=UPI00273B6B79
KPFPVRNCSLANQTYTSVQVRCHAGYDGGLPQEFLLEVYHGDIDSLASMRPLYNVSNKDEPLFFLTNLETSVDVGVHVLVYAVNAKGRSQPIVLSEVTFRDAEKRTGQDAGMGLPPLLGVLVGALVTLGMIIVALGMRARRERGVAVASKPQRQEKPAELSELPVQQYALQSLEQTVETDPDVIPNKFEGNLIEVSPPSYPGGGYSPGQWVTPGPTPSIDELCHKFTGRPTELRLPAATAAAAAASIASRNTSSNSATLNATGHLHHHQLQQQQQQQQQQQHHPQPNPTALTNTGVVVGAGSCVVVAGECLDGEAIKRRLMANRLPESCV